MTHEEYIEELKKLLEVFTEQVYHPMITLTNKCTLYNPDKAHSDEFVKEVTKLLGRLATSSGVILDKVTMDKMNTYEDYQKSTLKKIKDVLGLDFV